jgi:hypothetical protein
MVDRFCRVALGSVILAAVAVAGCAEQSERLNAPPQGDTSRPSALQKNFSYMTDNAMLLDSSVADIHFEPHVAELSGLGVTRLTRMGELLSASGGIIRYETSSTDSELIEARLETVRTFLASSGFDTEKITVEAGMARSQTMTAPDAIKAKGRATSKTEDAGGTSIVLPGAG